MHIDHLYNGYPLLLIPCMNCDCVHNKYIGLMLVQILYQGSGLSISKVQLYGIVADYRNQIDCLQEHIRSFSEAVVSLLMAIERTASGPGNWSEGLGSNRFS